MEKTMTQGMTLEEMGFSENDIKVIHQLEADGGGRAPVERGAMAVRFWTCMEIVSQKYFKGLDPDGLLASYNEVDEMTKAEFYAHFEANIAAMSRDERVALCHMASDLENDLEGISKRRKIMEEARKMACSD